MSQIEPQPGIMDIALYVGGASEAEGHAKPLKLSSNENPLGPSPAAVAAYRAQAERLALYPSSDHVALRTAIGAVHGLEPDRIICGAGSDELIAFLCQAFAGPGDEVVHSAHGFLMYRISALAAGARPVSVPERARHADVDAILARCNARTRLVFLANPNNPTGTMLPEAEVARLAGSLPSGALLVLDAAYAEYVEDGFDGGAALARAQANVVMLRTFSKIHGLGGLRVGWGYADRRIIDILNRVRGPFNLSAPAIAAAEAAIRDIGHVAQCRQLNAAQRATLAEALDGLGMPSDPSFGNFILVRLADADEARALDAHFRAAGIIVRQVAGYGLPECLRITVPDAAGTARVIAAAREFRAGQG